MLSLVAKCPVLPWCVLVLRSISCHVVYLERKIKIVKETLHFYECLRCRSGIPRLTFSLRVSQKAHAVSDTSYQLHGFVVPTVS